MILEVFLKTFHVVCLDYRVCSQGVLLDYRCFNEFQVFVHVLIFCVCFILFLLSHFVRFIFDCFISFFFILFVSSWFLFILFFSYQVFREP